MIIGVLIIGAVIIGLFGVAAFTGSPYVPTLRRDLRVLFDELYPIGKNDTLVDLGSGDGIVLRIADARGAQAIGVEINPILVGLSRLLSRGSPRVRVVGGSLWSYQMPNDVTVVYAFPNTRDVNRLVAYLKHEAARIGTSFHMISYGSELPGLIHVNSHGAHHLYEVSLQSVQPQV